MKSLTPEMHEKWHAFIDVVNEAVEHIFDLDNDHPAIVLGVQFGEMGMNDDLPVTVVTSNLPVCIVPGAIKDMLVSAEEAHSEVHENGSTITAEMNPDAVPEDIRAKAEEYAQSLGLDVSQIKYVEVADTSDLNDLPLFDPEALTQSPDEEPPTAPEVPC